MSEEEFVKIKKSELEDIVEEKVEERLQKRGSKRDSVCEKSKISRRNFLKKLGVGAIGIGALSLPSVSALDVKDDSLDVFTGTSSSDLTKYFSVSQGGPVNIQNTGLDLNNQDIENVGLINGQNADNLIYGDADARSAINNDADHGSTAPHNYFSGSYNDLTNVPSTFPPQIHGNDAHDASYITSAPVESVNGKTGAVSIDSGVSDHSNLSGITSNDHHTRYSDSEARTAVDNSNVSVGYAENSGQLGGQSPSYYMGGKSHFMAKESFTINSSSDETGTLIDQDLENGYIIKLVFGVAGFSDGGANITEVNVVVTYESGSTENYSVSAEYIDGFKSKTLEGYDFNRQRNGEDVSNITVTWNLNNYYDQEDWEPRCYIVAVGA